MAMNKTELCNLALGLIGSKRIVTSDLSNNTNTEARYCKLFYDPTKKAALRLCKPSCATKRANLGTAVSATPAFRYDYAYQLPNDCVRVIQMEELEYEWRREGDKLLTDESTAKIIYIFDLTDASKFDPLFVEVFSVWLGLKLAIPLSADKEIRDSLLNQLIKVSRPLAQGVDSQESSTQTLEVTSWLDEMA
jgi:hypothetical protein